MTPRRLSRQEQKQQTVERLLKAAARVFPRDGYHGASVEQIAEEAGYSHGAVYSNFSGKEELFMALAASLAAERLQETAAVYAQEASAADQARAAAALWMERVAKQRDTVLLRLEFALHAARNRRFRRALAKHESKIEDFLAERFVEQLHPPANWPVDAVELATVVRALGIGLAVEALVAPERVRPELLGDFAAWLIAQAAAGGP